MEYNNSQQRISIIKSALKKESSGHLYEDMTKKQRSQLCSSFKASESEIIGYYEDIMNLGKTILASASGKFVNQGLLFLKDSLVYRKGILSGVVKVFYDDIKLVEKGSFGTKIHYNKAGTPTTLTLSGIAYADSNEVISELLMNLRNLSSKRSDKTSAQEKKDNKKQEKQDNITKWNEHIRKCAQKNRIAQIQHLDDYLQFPSFNSEIVMAKLFCKETDDGTHVKRSSYIALYDKTGFEFKYLDFPIAYDETIRVFFKIIPFFVIKDDDYERKWWLQREKWNHGSNYDCDDSYSGKTYLLADGQEDYDSSIKTENDVFVQKSEIKHLPDRALLYLANIIDSWRDENLSEIVGNYNLWKEKKTFILGYETIVSDEIKSRGLERFPYKFDFVSSYGETGEKEVEYALKWLPSEYKRVMRISSEGIRLRNPSFSNESQEIDHIVVGPNGVFVIETKYLSGNITISENNSWTRIKNKETEVLTNPIQQVDRHHLIVKSILKDLLDENDIHDIICLSHKECTVTGAAFSPVPVVKVDMLVRHITDSTSKKTYGEEEINKILDIIKTYRIN